MQAVEESAVGGVEVGDGPMKAVELDKEVVLGDGGVLDGESVAFDNSPDSDCGSGMASYVFSLSGTLFDYQHQI